MKKTTIKKLAAYYSQMKRIRDKIADIILEEELTEREEESLYLIFDNLNETCGEIAVIQDRANTNN